MRPMSEMLCQRGALGCLGEDAKANSTGKWPWACYVLMLVNFDIE
jgi:hypothetical protein